MLDLDEKYVNFIKETILTLLPDIEIFIFGSRVQGNALEYSDVDIALKDVKKISFEILLKLRARFEDSTFPYKVDIVDLNNLKENFREIIEKDLYKI